MLNRIPQRGKSQNKQQHNLMVCFHIYISRVGQMFTYIVQQRHTSKTNSINPIPIVNKHFFFRELVAIISYLPSTTK